MTIGVTPASHSGISNQAQAEQAAAKIRLERLRVIASAVNAGGDIETILDRVLLAVCRGEPWPRGGIMAVNRQSGYSEMVTGYDPDGPLPGLWRDNLDASSATIRMRVCGRGGWMIAAERHGRKRFPGRRDNQDEVLIVARVGGRPGPRLRSTAARLR